MIQRTRTRTNPGGPGTMHTGTVLIVDDLGTPRVSLTSAGTEYQLTPVAWPAGMMPAAGQAVVILFREDGEPVIVTVLELAPEVIAPEVVVPPPDEPVV